MPHQDSHVPDRLRAAGLRITAPRVAVLEWLAEHPHTTADQVAEGVRPALGAVSAQAVYDVLSACSKARLLRRIAHHHLVCRNCGRTEDVDCVDGSAPCLEPDDATGFAVDEAEVVFWGLCPACIHTHHKEAPA
jgi:Fur family ferric uptake transcriptional regulator